MSEMTTTADGHLELGEGYALYRHSSGLGRGLDEAYQRLRTTLIHGTSLPVAANDVAYKLGALRTDALHLRGTWEYEATDEALFWCSGTQREQVGDTALATAQLAGRLAEELAALRERVLAVKAASTGKGATKDWVELAAIADRLAEVAQWLGHNVQA